MTHAMKSKGFTIVELLIVIVIIGVLVSLVVTAYQGIQDRATYTKTRDAIVKTAKAFRLKAIADGKYQQDEYYFTCAGIPIGSSNNIYIYQILDGCRDQNPLSNYLDRSDFVQYGVPIVYDNDLDTYTGCSVDNTSGVNFFFGATGVTDATMDKLDVDLDKGDGLVCGDVRKAGSQKYFMIAKHSTEGI